MPGLLRAEGSEKAERLGVQGIEGVIDADRDHPREAGDSRRITEVVVHKVLDLSSLSVWQVAARAQLACKSSCWAVLAH